MQKLVHFSEGVRESLRRLSSITWMAEELLKVADYLQPDKWVSQSTQLFSVKKKTTSYKKTFHTYCLHCLSHFYELNNDPQLASL